MLKNKKGITLIALVVTIVVLLILAGVSISLILDNNGIIQKSKDAKRKYGQARTNEQSDLNNISYWIDEAVGEINWNKILDDAKKNPDKYKHSEQTSTNGDIGIGTDGKPVNLDLWTYKVINENEITLGEFTGCNCIPGYQNSNIVNGKIQGKVPQYIKINGNDEFYAVTSMRGTFGGCTRLTTAPEIPSSVTDMTATFFSCTSLTIVPKIPSGVINMKRTFFECTSLTTAPEIPSSVTDMFGTFTDCTSLTTAPEIPSSVTYMGLTFQECTSLQGTIEIDANPTEYVQCFNNAATEGTGLVVIGKSTMLDEIIATKGTNNTKITKGN